jgi:hypothetical protein
VARGMGVARFRVDQSTLACRLLATIPASIAIIWAIHVAVDQLPNLIESAVSSVHGVFYDIYYNLGDFQPYVTIGGFQDFGEFGGWRDYCDWGFDSGDFEPYQVAILASIIVASLFLSTFFFGCLLVSIIIPGVAQACSEHEPNRIAAYRSKVHSLRIRLDAFLAWLAYLAEQLKLCRPSILIWHWEAPTRLLSVQFREFLIARRLGSITAQ